VFNLAADARAITKKQTGEYANEDFSLYRVGYSCKDIKTLLFAVPVLDARIANPMLLSAAILYACFKEKKKLDKCIKTDDFNVDIDKTPYGAWKWFNKHLVSKQQDKDTSKNAYGDPFYDRVPDAREAYASMFLDEDYAERSQVSNAQLLALGQFLVVVMKNAGFDIYEKMKDYIDFAAKYFCDLKGIVLPVASLMLVQFAECLEVPRETEAEMTLEAVNKDEKFDWTSNRLESPLPASSFRVMYKGQEVTKAWDKTAAQQNCLTSFLKGGKDHGHLEVSPLIDLSKVKCPASSKSTVNEPFSAENNRSINCVGNGLYGTENTGDCTWFTYLDLSHLVLPQPPRFYDSIGC
jgi:hypothetical protein